MNVIRLIEAQALATKFLEQSSHEVATSSGTILYPSSRLSSLIRELESSLKTLRSR